MAVKQEEKNFLRFMQGSDCDSYLKAKQSIKKILAHEVHLGSSFKYQIKDNIKKINNILVLIYIHSLGIELSYASYVSYGQKFDMITMQEGCYEAVQLWWFKQNAEDQNETIELILENMSQFIIKECKRYVFSRDLTFMLIFFNRLKVRRERDVTVTTTFLSNLSDFYLNQHYGYESKELLLTRLVCQILEREQGEGNLGSIIDEFFIRDVEGTIWKFCELRRYNISQISEDGLLTIFRGLCKGGVNYCLLHLCLNISTVLQAEEEFYKLRHLFQNFILSEVAGRMKTCTKLRVDEKALQLCQLYIHGFYQHCRLDKVCIQSLVSDIDGVRSAAYRKRWVQLAMIAAGKSGEEKYLHQLLQKTQFKGELSQIEKDLSSKQLNIWDITTRNIKKHKYYKYSPSDFRGIINDYCDCYIISTVQALFMTKSLYNLLNKIKKASKISLLSSLVRLFIKLEEKKAAANVLQLKKRGPAQFTQSVQQEDAHQYLLYLMSMLESQFKDEGLLKQFKALYEIESKSTITCELCGHRTENIQQDYCYTVSNKQKIKAQYEEELRDFKCQKCGKTKSRKVTKMTLPKQIFIVHINRFSMLDKQAKKQLPTQSIPRQFEGFQLVGMVFHIGKNVQSGHYVYYSKLDARKWLYFNDNSVTQFRLENEGQRFEKEMKAQHTPYILFYKRMK